MNELNQKQLKNQTQKPIIAVTCCQKTIGNQHVQTVQEKYLKAVYDFGGLPVVVPNVIDANDVAQFLAKVDGIMLTGSPSNVAPQRYNATNIEPDLDLARDEVSFAMINYAVKNDMPLLGVCRGFQELNAALGGTLYPKLHEVGKFIEHREPKNDDIAVQYAANHDINIVAGSFLAGFGQSSYKVNSLHGQGANVLAKSLVVQATAPDGLVEAVKVADKTFIFAVQWHPEWKAIENPLSQFIYKQFIDHARQYRK